MKKENKADSKNILWLVVSVILLAAVLLVSFNKNFDLTGALFNVGALRFIGLALLAFCLGMFFKKTWLKMTLFCLLAVFAALAFMEVYLNAKDKKNTPAYTYNYTTPDNGEGPAFNYHYSHDPVAMEKAPYATEEGVLYHVEDAAAVLREKGLEVSPDATTAPYMNTGDAKLGYRMVRSPNEILAVRMDGDNVVYAVIYHLTSDGWRVTPYHENATKAVVFLGDSYTFGSGLNDEETFAYKTGLTLGEDYQVFNFGVGGWGTHQVLTMIEDGWLGNIARIYDDLYVFYMPIDDHMRRLSGQASWDEWGPCYQMQPDGSMKYMGAFNSPECQQQQSSSRLFAKLTEERYLEEMMLAMIRQMDRRLKEEYGVRLVLIRPYTDYNFLSVLEKEGIDIISVMLEPPSIYAIPVDGHPNAVANELFTEKVVEYIKTHKAPN